MYIKELTCLRGVPGKEDAVREFILDKIRDNCDEIYRDSIGNLIAVNKSKKENAKKVMLCAHMDEVGLIVTKITDDGFLKFDELGGIDTSVLVSKKVLVGDKAIPGVIGAKAIHLQKKSERGKEISMDELYIDIGAKDKKEAEKKVALGDYATFLSDYVEFGDGFIKSKALDDRLGCSALIGLSANHYDFDLYLVFTAQEETGLRGAKVATERINPDLAIVLETTACGDSYGAEDKDFVTTAGGGVALSFLDMRTIYNRELLDSFVSVAEKYNIPYQFKKGRTGGNDAGIIHLSCGGVKTMTLSVPTKYIHSPSSVIKISDYMAMKELVTKYLEEVAL